MPIPDSSAINDQINTAIAELTKVSPFPIEVEVLLQIEPLLEAAQRVLDDPRSIGDEVKKMLAELKKSSLSVDISLTANVVTSLDEIVALLQRLREAFTNGSIAEIDLPPLVEKLAGKIIDAIPPGLIDFAKKLQSRAPVDALANLFAGSNSAALSAPRSAVLKKVEEIAQAASELLPITVRLESLTVAIDEIIVLLEVDPPAEPDFSVIGPKLVRIDADVDVLIGDLTPLLRKVAAKLDSIDTTAFTANLIAAFDAIADALPDAPVRLSPLFDPLREARNELHALAGGDLSEMIDEIVADVRSALESTGIQDAGTTIQSIVTDAIKKVDLEGLKTRVKQFLDDARASIDDVAATLPQQLQQKLGELADAIAAIDVEKITHEVFGRLDPIATAYQNAIDGVHDDVEALIGTVDDYLKEVLKALNDIDAELQNLAKELDAIDFEAAAAESRRLMEEIRTNVEEVLRTADLPPAARTAITLGAQALKSIDFEGDVAQPIHAEIDKADPTPIIERLEAEVAKIRAFLASVVPSELVAQLDPPFDRAVAALAPYTHEALKARVAEELEKLETLLDHCDPGPLLMQLEAEHANLVIAAKAHSDLNPFFEPIEHGYADAIAAIDNLHLRDLLDEATAAIVAIPQQIETAVHEAMSEAAALTAQVPQFHLGDILRPLAEVVADLRDQLDAMSDAELEAIALAVVAPVLFLQNLGDLHAVFGSNPVVSIDAAWDELTASYESLDLLVQAQAEAGNTTIDVNLGVRLQAVTPDFTELAAAAQRLLDRIATPELIASANRLAAAIQQALPPELLAISEETSPRAAVELILDTIDPAPLVAELDQIGIDIDADIGICAQAIADGIVKLVHEAFGALNASDINNHLQQTLTAIEDQLEMLDPTPVKQDLQNVANSAVHLTEELSPKKMKESIDAVLQNVKTLMATMNEKVSEAIGELSPIPDLTPFRPSETLEDLVKSAKNLQDALDRILQFEFGDPLLRTLERLRPSLNEVLDDLFIELDHLLQFLEQQKAA